MLKKFVFCMDLHEIWKGLKGLVVGKEGGRRARQIPEGWVCHTAALNPGQLDIRIVPQSPTCSWVGVTPLFQGKPDESSSAPCSMQTLTHNMVTATRMAAIASPSLPAWKDICVKSLLSR